MELVFVVAGIVLVWYFATTIKAFSSGAESKAQVMAESVIAGAVQERTEIVQQFQKDMEGKTVYSHEEVMKLFKID